MKGVLQVLAVILLALTYHPVLSRPVAGPPELVAGQKQRAVSKGGPPDHEKVRREITRIMASPEYNRSHTPSMIEKLQARAGKWVRDVVGGILKWIAERLSFGNLEGAGILATLGTWLVVVAFIALLGLIAWRYTRGAGGRGPSGKEEDASYELPSAGPLIKQAAKLAEAGDYRGAFRAAYLASIAHLDGIRALRFERSRTNWEYMRELKRGGHEKPHSELHPITLDFDRKIYGRETCVRQDYLNAAAVYERLSSEEAK